MKLGLVISSGGSAFAEAALALRAAGQTHSYTVVTDRQCGAEARCEELGVDFTRISEKNPRTFSQRAAERLSAEGVDVVLLFFVRLVTAELFESHVTLNIHPALLPAYPGLGAIRQAFQGRARFVGATLHRVDASLDGGPIIAQTVSPIPMGADEALLNKMSFIQKIYLTLLAIELIGNRRLEVAPGKELTWNGSPMFTSNSNPSLTNLGLLSYLDNLCHAEHVEVAR